MLHRDYDTGYLLVSQPAHAWVAGQLAAAWGNARFGEVRPRPEVCLAAQEHDIGWLTWEQNPTLNPVSGRPRTFRELPTLEHVSVWEPAGPLALAYGPYVALLVSMHGTGLYQQHDFARDSEADAIAARRFITSGAAFEEQLLQDLSGSERYAQYSDPDTLARNRRLVAVWDALSLMLCGGLQSARQIDNVPAVDEELSISMVPDSSQPDVLTLDPWPFADRIVRLTCPARLVRKTFSDQTEMRQAIEQAPWRSIDIDLVAREDAG